MADDREVLKETWEGKVPVCFSLATEEVVSVDQPDPIYLLLPRQSYFPLVTDKVEKHFHKYIDKDSQGEMWLEDTGQPLRWHYPIGVVFDIQGADSRLPWALTVHFQNFPEKDLLHCPSRDAVEAHFIAMVKEADCLKHRSKVINDMQKRDHNQLWSGLKNYNFDHFWAVNRKLMEHIGDELFRHIPFRIYVGESPFVQTLISPKTGSDSHHTTLSDLLRNALPDIADCILTETNQPDVKKKYRVIIQGIEPPFESTLQWLSEHFSHPDNFLHICVLTL